MLEFIKKKEKKMVEKILLGYGEFSIGGVPIGLTRGGGSFTVETEYREIEADGDKGAVKGRVVIDRQDAKLTLNALTAFGASDIKKYYPALTETLGEIKPTLKIDEGDYQEVKWVGKTMEGKAVTITLDNALNMGDLDFTLEDKDEVVPELEFTATYLESDRNGAPWGLTFEQGE